MIEDFKPVLISGVACYEQDGTVTAVPAKASGPAYILDI